MNRSAIVKELESKGLTCSPDESADDLKEILAAWNTIESPNFDFNLLTDTMLFKLLRSLGTNPGPIGPTTRGVYENKLQRILDNRKGVSSPQYSSENKSSGNILTSTPKYEKLGRSISPTRSTYARSPNDERLLKMGAYDQVGSGESKLRISSEHLNYPPKTSRKFGPEQVYKEIPVVLSSSAEAPRNSTWKDISSETRSRFQDSPFLSSVKSTPSSSSGEWIYPPQGVNIRKRDPLKHNEADLQDDLAERQSSSFPCQVIAVLAVGITLLLLFMMFEKNPKAPIPM